MWELRRKEVVVGHPPPSINKNDFFFFFLTVVFPPGFKVSQGDLYHLKIYFRTAIGLHGKISRGCVYGERIYTSIYIFTKIRELHLLKIYFTHLNSVSYRSVFTIWTQWIQKSILCCLVVFWVTLEV